MSVTRFGKRRFVGTNGIAIPEKKKESFRREGMKLLYIGRLEVATKGLDLMLDAIKINADLMRAKKVTLDMYGPDHQGRVAALREMIAERGIGDIVTLSDPIVGEEKEAAYLDADAFIQTSRTEGMPMGILEALSYGLPCLVTEGTTLRTLIDDNDAGWGCGTNTEEISEALVKLINEADLFGQKSQAARSFADNNFSWRIVSATTLRLYSEIADNK
jgi:glycosyltransferase involved in cell wall biosynthesis